MNGDLVIIFYLAIVYAKFHAEYFINIGVINDIGNNNNIRIEEPLFNISV